MGKNSDLAIWQNGKWIEAVFRYHLVRCGDWQDAEGLVIQTLVKAKRSGIEQPYQLFRLASMGQVREHPSLKKLLRSGPDDQNQQAQLLQRAKITSLAGYWQSIPDEQTETLILACFARLDNATISKVIRRPASLIEAWLAKRSGEVSEFYSLAETIQVPEGLLGRVASAQAQEAIPGNLQKWIKQGGQAFNWEIQRKRRQAASSLNRLAPILLVCILVGLITSITLPMLSRPQVSQSVQPIDMPSDTSTFPVANAGLLVPPDDKVCQDWASSLSSILAAPASLSQNKLFNDPSGSGPEFIGTSCLITITGQQPGQNSQQHVADLVLSAFKSQGYQIDSQFRLTLDTSKTGGIDSTGDVGERFRIHRDQLRAVLEISPNQPGSNPCNSPSCPTATFNTGTHPILVNLSLATHELVPIVVRFFDQWAAGDKSILQSLDPNLRTGLPDLFSLDDAVGIQRASGSRPKFNWTVKDNSGQVVRLVVSADQTSVLALPYQAPAEFQMAFSKPTGQWQVSAITAPGVLSSQNQDELILADSQGQVYLQPLDGGVRKNLTAPGFYPVIYPIQPVASPSISPDGKWLFLAPGKDQPAWLVSLEGQPAVSLDLAPDLTAWSPDSQQIAFVPPDAPRRLMSANLPGGKLARLADLPGDILQVSWSRGGKDLGIAYRSPDAGKDGTMPGGTANNVKLARLNLQNGEMVLYKADLFLPTSIPINRDSLIWEANDSELWFIPSFASIHVGDAQRYDLIRIPIIDSNNYFQFTISELLNVYYPRSPMAISPDGSRLAVVFAGAASAETTSYTNLELQSTGNLGKNLWVKQVPKLGLIDWSGNSQNLVAASSDSEIGQVYQIDPDTGEFTTIARDMIYIGLRSALQRTGQPSSKAVGRIALPTPASSVPWATVAEDGLRLKISLPASWRIWQSPGGTGSTYDNVVLANFDFSTPMGFTSLEPGDVYLWVTRQSLNPGQAPQSWLESQIQGNNDAFTPVTLAGQPGYRSLKLPDNPFFGYVLFASSTDSYSIGWNSFNPDTNTIVDRILQSIQILN